VGDDMNSIGNGRGIGGALRHALQGESFIRHIGNDKLIFDFHEGSGTTVYDKSHCGNNGTLGTGNALPTWRRNSLYFDGGDLVTLTGINHGITTGGFTFCFNLDSFVEETFIYDQATTRFIILCRTDKINIFSASYKIISVAGVTSTKPIIFQVTKDISNNLECHINGKSSGIGLSSATDLTYGGISVARLGANSDVTPGKFITGTMYSFRILNKGLSGIECQQEYLSNKFRGNN